MGRHAAPSDDETEAPESDQLTIRLDKAVGDEPAEVRSRPTPRGRHSRPEDADVDAESEAAETEAAEAVTVRLPVPETEPRAAKKEGATAADVRLLRTDSALRNRVVAAVIVPFVLYTVILLAIGRLDAFAVWVWLPLITAGISAGLMLDRAHAKEKKS